MRFLHTSDWHLGRRFHEADLIDAQRAFLTHIYDTARERQVDAILVAGDIYDRAIPSLDAVRLFDGALTQLAELHIPIIMISGNHDSAHRLGVGASVLARAGVHLRTDPDTACTRPVLLDDDHGTVAVYGIPYLEPSLTHDGLDTDKSHQAVTTAAMDRIRTDLASYPPPPAASSSPTPSSPAARAPAANATSPSEDSTTSPPAPSTTSTTSPSATFTARRTSTTASTTAVHRSPTPSPKPTTPSP